MVWTLRTPAAKPLGDGSLRGLVKRARATARSAPACCS